MAHDQACKKAWEATALHRHLHAGVQPVAPQAGKLTAALACVGVHETYPKPVPQIIYAHGYAQIYDDGQDSNCSSPTDRRSTFEGCLHVLTLKARMSLLCSIACASV